MNTSIRVVLVDDFPVFREGLRLQFERAGDIDVVGEAGNGQVALKQIEKLRPDVIVLNCRMPELDGPAVAEEIRRRNLPGRVLALCAQADDASIRAMLDVGAVGYLLKSEPPEVIVQAVRAVAEGRSSFSAEVAAKLAARVRGERTAEQKLSKREREVARLLAHGWSNEQIAKKLGISARTARLHVRNIQDKVGAQSRAEVVAWAAKRQLDREE